MRRSSPPPWLCLAFSACTPEFQWTPPAPTDSGAPTTTTTTETIESSTPALCDTPNQGLSVCIDELQSNNDATWQSDPGVFPDWIEIRNAGTTVVEAGWIELWVGNTGPFLLSGPPLDPGETRMVVAAGPEGPTQDPSAERPWHSVATALSSDGETVSLSVLGQPADAVKLPALSGDTSLARDANDAFLVVCDPTPGEVNPSLVPCVDSREWAFELGRIHDFYLYLEPDAWATLETSSTFFHPPAPGRLVFAGGEFPAVEVNLKGGYGSFRSDLDSQKVALKVDLNVFEDRRWHGLEKLTFNNFVQDPTFLHEYLTYELYREAGVPAPRMGYARLWVNDVFFGCYGLVEAVDDTFLSLWYADASGHLLESAYGPDFDPGEETLFEYDEGPDEVEGRALIAEVSTLLSSSPWDEATLVSLDALVDVDEFMLNMAVEGATWHWDGYTTENNYYLYHEPMSSQWQMLPHGTDQTWVDGWPNVWDGNTRSAIYSFCLAVPSCLARYEAAVLAVADAVDRLPLEARLDTLIALTEPEFAVDPRVEDAGGRVPEIDGTRARIQTVSAALRDAAATH